MGEVIIFPSRADARAPAQIAIEQDPDGAWLIFVDCGQHRDIALPIAFSTIGEAETMARNFAKDAGVHFPDNGEVVVWNQKTVDRSEAWVIEHLGQEFEAGLAGIIASGLPSFTTAVRRAIAEAKRIDAFFPVPFHGIYPGAA